MVKLASVRATRLYGPRSTKVAWEDANAFGYLVAALLLTAGCALLLPGYNLTAGLWLILVALAVILICNIHDLFAQLAGFDFRLCLVTLDPQLALIEIAVPLVHSIGVIVYFIACVLLLAHGDVHQHANYKAVRSHAFNMFIAAPALWLLGSIHNAFQAYASADLQVQAMQKGVTIPFVIGSTILLIAGIVNRMRWPVVAQRESWHLAASLAVAGTATLLVGAVVNSVRVIQLQQVDETNGRAEKLLGGAEERLHDERERREWQEPLLAGNSQKHGNRDMEIESGRNENPYKAHVVEAERVP